MGSGGGGSRSIHSLEIGTDELSLSLCDIHISSSFSDSNNGKKEVIYKIKTTDKTVH